jgi:sugar/nucleoside kinase (ribokinase family)
LAQASGDQAATILVVKGCLEKLRRGQGVRVQRLTRARAEAVPILDLPVVRRLAGQLSVSEEGAAREAVRRCALTGLTDTQRVVADAVLSLELLGARYDEADINQRAVARLYSPNLGTRREALLTSWTMLHRAVGVERSPVPSDRTLRGQLEDEVLFALARLLVTTPAERLVDPGRARSAPEGQRRGRAVVIGGAVMDLSLTARSIPTMGTSEEALDFGISPGGKGVTQAVAVARLGMDTALVAAVGDDAFGDGILTLLQDEGVDTRFVKIVPHARTPVTSVINVDGHHNFAFNWRNDGEVRLEPRDVTALADELAGVDVLHLTFEPPLSLVQYVLAHLLGDLETRPVTIVTAGPPYRHQSIDNQALAQIDFLVAHQWELLAQFARSAGPAQSGESMESLAERMLALGLGTLCVPLDSGCAVYSHQLGSFTVPTFPTLYRDPAGARDAYCAALGVQLWEEGAGFSSDVALWATAAMAATGDGWSIPTSMPRRKQIESILTRSRFGARSASAGQGPSGSSPGPPTVATVSEDDRT